MFFVDEHAHPLLHPFRLATAVQLNLADKGRRAKTDCADIRHRVHVSITFLMGTMPLCADHEPQRDFTGPLLSVEGRSQFASGNGR
jgi:hypothetical protein